MGIGKESAGEPNRSWQWTDGWGPGYCWECGTRLETDEERDVGAHECCIRAHLDYVERWDGVELD